MAVISDFMDLPAMFDDQRVYSKPPEAWPESISVLKKNVRNPPLARRRRVADDCILRLGVGMLDVKRQPDESR